VKISVVTISYNQIAFLKRCIDSVHSQSGDFELEHIIVDPGSTDGSRELIDSYGDKVVKIYEKDSGPADGLNKGFSIATGEIYGFLNSDDILLDGALEKVIEKFRKYKKIDVISFNGYEIDEQDNIVSILLSNKFDYKAYAYGCCVLLQQSTFFKSEVFQAVSGFNVDNKISWDGELWFDMARKKFKFKKFSGYLSGFRIYDASITGSGEHVDRAELVLKRHRDQIGEGNSIGFCRKYFLWLKVRIFDFDFWLNKIRGFLV
jgi:glycosyltransferase involved in cell wall biosynthesis